MSLAVSVLSVGDELLAGDVVDTNSAWIARELAARGHRLVQVRCVGDRIDEIRAAVDDARRANERGDCDLLVTTGGLGPTRDDLTRDGVAAALGLALRERGELLRQVQGRNPTLGTLARRQAEIPEGGEVLPNRRGTAPGFLVHAAALAVACLPGPPSELHPMVRELLDRLAPEGQVRTRKLRLSGLTESVVGDALSDLMDEASAGCRVGVTARLGVITVSIRGADVAARDAVAEAVYARFGDDLFGEGDTTLASVVVGLLAERGWIVTCAESCTGGLLAAAITSVPGASAVLREALVTYANEAKQERLGVSAALLAEHGAVSEPVARAMAEGARTRSGADLALAITGIAGPDGGTPEKPVGTVWFAVADGRGTVSRLLQAGGSREEIRRRAVRVALDLARRRLLDQRA